jgi:hypothetical protein
VHGEAQPVRVAAMNVFAYTWDRGLRSPDDAEG